VNETGDDMRSLTICDVSYVAQTLLISVLWAHIAIHNPFERDHGRLARRAGLSILAPCNFGGGFREGRGGIACNGGCMGWNYDALMQAEQFSSLRVAVTQGVRDAMLIAELQMLIVA
jgi:hypothetical protein